MSRKGRKLAAAFACAASLLTSTAVFAQAPFADTHTATLRCLYQDLTDPTGARTGEIEAPGSIAGTWRYPKVWSWSKFFTTYTPQAEVDALCEKAVAGLPDARYVQARVAGTGLLQLSYQIWYTGDVKPDAPIERIVSFGDSLTDTGNMSTVSQTFLSFFGGALPSSTWFAGRFSNGPSWVEYLASRNALTHNSWAVGGAQTEDAQFGLINGIESQIKSFFDSVDVIPDYKPERTLFTFLVAGNDFVNDSKYATDIVRLQREALNNLVDGGARKILVVELPNVSVAPVFDMGRKDREAVHQRVYTYNSGLDGIIANVKKRAQEQGILDLEIRKVPAYAKFDQVLRSPASYGFDNIKNSCLEIDSDSFFNYIKTPKPRDYCVADRFMFWDTLHPSTKMHEVMSRWATEYGAPAWELK
ncbi:SGNH/GDSL hydrolase family protein [Luteibacter anthropi]|uniref:SGNH/GDSL hydrolase family protein n=1 Tax=Luteibacter anthropi TaxID=564369 RepID=A0A7X5ZJF4_9GAMM|nr:SGNH/GDSL hydrolase family protein [Luteibacter anthropi]NII07908.1 SGNH/GDSL hydrolase family protein [Luteibacter anthropi]URX63449.1 SGNH/GDSL hydrolase family protein [Luteibacter anthropi]